MDLNDAFIRAVRSYFNETKLAQLDKVSEKERRYTKAYFDSIEKEFGLSDIEAKDQDEIKKDKD